MLHAQHRKRAHTHDGNDDEDEWILLNYISFGLQGANDVSGWKSLHYYIGDGIVAGNEAHTKMLADWMTADVAYVAVVCHCWLLLLLLIPLLLISVT